ncbi:MAG: hypothetical protein H6684_10890 [Deltaproteobacteria bacterium]|nr:hypothetical protein [Deltaproteobacteria bacterium]
MNLRSALFAVVIGVLFAGVASADSVEILRTDDRLTTHFAAESGIHTLTMHPVAHPADERFRAWRSTDDEALLVERAGRYTGVMIDGSRTFRIRPTTTGHELTRVARRASLECLTPDAAALPPLEIAKSAPRKAAGTATIEVLVVYTPKAAAAVEDIEAEIALAAEQANASYVDSGVFQRLHIAATRQVEYGETGLLAVDLAALTWKNEGVMDEVHAWREEAGADLVALIVSDGGKFCGSSNIMSTLSLDFAAQAFSVIALDCAVSQFSFVHELGHLMGARHDVHSDDTTGAPFDFNHGHILTEARRRTIMAFDNFCTGEGYVCPRLGRWSDPTATYEEEALGDAATADNVRTLNATAPYVSNFHEGVLPADDDDDDDGDDDTGDDDVPDDDNGDDDAAANDDVGGDDDEGDGGAGCGC